MKIFLLLFLSLIYLPAFAYPMYFPPENYSDEYHIMVYEQPREFEVQESRTRTRLMELEIAKQEQAMKYESNRFYEQMADRYGSDDNFIKLNLFSSDKYHQYLGCVNCSPDMIDSIFNHNGIYGNENDMRSIFHAHNIYISPKSNFSMCNYKANFPPFVEDEDGKFYGYLTVNKKNIHSIKDKKLISWLNKSICY